MSLFWRSNLALSVSVVAGLYAATIPALYAAEATRHYIISAGSLSAALLAVSRQGDQLIVFKAADIEGFRADAIEGDFALDKLLDRLLKDHALTYSQDSRGAVVIKRSGQEATVTEGLTLPTLVVFGDGPQSDGMASTKTSTTRTGAPLRLTPQSITVINNKVMEAQGARTISEVLKNVAGVQVIPSSTGQTGLNIRGYSGSTTSNGLSGTGSLSAPTIAIESVEALKGPNAILTGMTSPGGTINVNYKKPQLQSAHQVRLGYGSYDERQLSADSTGALFGSDNLSYRVILDSREARRNAAGYDGLSQLFFSPSLRWQDDDTDFTLRYVWLDSRTPFFPYTVGYEGNGRPWTGHFPEPLGNKDDQLSLDQNELSFDLEQRLTDHWQFVSKGAYGSNKTDLYGYYPFSTLDRRGWLYLNTFYQEVESTQLSLDNYVRGTYEWGDLKSTTVLGVTASRNRSHQKSQSDFSNFRTINIFDPVPALPPAKSTYRPLFTETTPVGAYWQQLLSYGKWHLNGGLRFSGTWNGVFRSDEATEMESVKAWSPSIGIAYEVTPWLTAYASSVRGYQPPLTTDRNGNLLPPQISKQKEAGLKFSLLDDKLQITTSAFKTEIINYSLFVRSEGGYVATPGYVSRGFEVEVQGDLSPRWSLTGSYNYADTEFIETGRYHVGLPRQKASVWTRYKFDEGLLKGVSVGGGVYYSGTAELDTTGFYKIPPQFETNLNLGYEVGHYNFALTARNVFDEDLYVTSTQGDPTFISLQQPRNIQLSATYKF